MVATSSFLGALGLAAGHFLLQGALAFSPLRSFLLARLPKPGEGPTREQMAAGHYRGVVIGRSADGAQATARLAIEGGDPGYSRTAVMLAEAGLTALLNRKELEAAAQGGCLPLGILRA